MDQLRQKIKQNKKWFIGAVGVLAITLAIVVFGPHEKRASAMEYEDFPLIPITRDELIQSHPAHQG